MLHGDRDIFGLKAGVNRSLSDQQNKFNKFDSWSVLLNILPTMWILPAGLYDMMGNTWEWTSTQFPGAQPMYVLRGGSWIDTVDGSANHKARITTRWVIKKKKTLQFQVLTLQRLMVLTVCPSGWETLLTPPLITWGSGVLPAMDRNEGRKGTKVNCRRQKEQYVDLNHWWFRSY